MNKQNSKSKTDEKFVQLKDLPDHILSIIGKLSDLATRGLWQQKLVFTYDEVKKVYPEISSNSEGDINGFGLLKVVQHHVGRGAGTTFSFNFLHLTMQEFLAAYHVSTLPREEELCRAFSDRLSNYVWIMYVGIVGIESDSFIRYLKHHCKDSSLHKNKLFAFQCYLEARSINKVPENISSVFENGVVEEQEALEPYNIVALVNFMLRSTTRFKSLNLSKCRITDEGLTVLYDFFTDHKNKISSIKNVCLKA